MSKYDIYYMPISLIWLFIMRLSVLLEIVDK